MRRTFTVLACVALLAGACAPAPSGPRQPVEQEQLTGEEAANSADARATAIAFVRAYGAADPTGLAVMTSLAGSPVVRGWVHWQAVQYVEFPGSVEGSVDLRDVGVAGSVADIPGTSTLLREVPVQADITFDYTPDEGDPFSNTRTIDALRVARDEGRPWVVVDLVRDGVPISTVFQPIGDEVVGDGVTVELDSFIADPESTAWQFDLVVRSSLDVDLALDPTAAILVGRDGSQISAATSVSSSLASIGPGPGVEGLVRFDALDDATGVTLSLTFAGPGSTGSAEFPLKDLIEPVASASPAP
jgi:hypothetical protein